VLERLSGAAPRAAEAAGPAVAPEGGVVLYCTPWCPSCPRARNYLKERGIPYVEVNIARDREAAGRVRSWANGNETTPTLDIQGTIVVDWDQARVERALAAAGLGS